MSHLRDLCLKSRSWKFSHTFSSRSFVVFVFTFTSMIHFESASAHGMRWQFTFICVRVHSAVPASFVEMTLVSTSISFIEQLILSPLEADQLLEIQLCDLINTPPRCLHSFEFCIILWSQKPSGWNRCCQEVAPGRSSRWELCRPSVEWPMPSSLKSFSVCTLYVDLSIASYPQRARTIKFWPTYCIPREREATKPDQSKCSLAGTLARVIKKRCCLLL